MHTHTGPHPCTTHASPEANSSPGTVIVDARFRGPAQSANGGYTAGLLAEVFGDCEVTLTAPPPLDIEMRTVWNDDRLELRIAATDDVVAYARASKPLEPPPAPVSFERASVARHHFIGHHHHPLPECFVCGTQRDAGDALRVFCGSENGSSTGPIYAPWVPSLSLAAPDGERVATRFVVAALDCPGGWACIGSREVVMLLGRMAFRVVDTVRVGERCVVVGANRGRDGRKNYADSAIYGEDGRLIAHSQQIWIEIEPRPGL